MGRLCELVKVRILARDVERRLQIKVGLAFVGVILAIRPSFFMFPFLVYLLIFKTEKMKKILLLLTIYLTGSVTAQNYVHQVYVLNEGYFDYNSNTILEPVTLGAYDPQTGVYNVVDTIENMRFASDMILSGDFLFVAADNQILKYNKYTNQLLVSTACPGVRNLAVVNDQLIATRGEYLTTFDSYLHVYDANSLQLTHAFDTITGPKWATQNLVVNGTTVYVAVNNAYEWGNEKGLIGKLDLATMTYGAEIDLGPDGKNPDNMVVSGNYIYTVNNKDWSGASVSKIELSSNLSTTSTISSAITGCGTSCLRDGNIVYQISGESILNEWNVLSMSPVGPVSNLSLNYYEITQDETNGLFYASNTDFFSYGKVFIYDGNNIEIGSFDAGVSPGTIVFDVRNSAQVNQNSLEFNISPNPSNGLFKISGMATGEVKISTSTGSVVKTENLSSNHLLDLTNLSEGTYFITITANGQSTTHRIVKI